MKKEKKKCETCRYSYENLRIPYSYMGCTKRKNTSMNHGRCRTWAKKFNPEMAKLRKELEKNMRECGV